MSARVSPQTDVIQGANPDGDAQDIVVNRDGMLRIQDLSMHDLLCQILIEMRKHTIHFQSMTDIEPDAADVGEEEACE